MIGEPHDAARSRRRVHQFHRGCVRALGAEEIGDQRQRHRVTHQSVLGEIGQVVTRVLRVRRVADDVDMPERGEVASQRRRVETEPRERCRSLAGDEQIGRAQQCIQRA